MDGFLRSLISPPQITMIIICVINNACGQSGQPRYAENAGQYFTLNRKVCNHAELLCNEADPN